MLLQYSWIWSNLRWTEIVANWSSFGESWKGVEVLQFLACWWHPHPGGGPHKSQQLQLAHDLAIQYVYSTALMSMSTTGLLFHGLRNREFCTHQSEIACQKSHSFHYSWQKSSLHQLPISSGLTNLDRRIHFALSWSDLCAIGWSLWAFDWAASVVVQSWD